MWAILDYLLYLLYTKEEILYGIRTRFCYLIIEFQPLGLLMDS